MLGALEIYPWYYRVFSRFEKNVFCSTYEWIFSLPYYFDHFLSCYIQIVRFSCGIYREYPCNAYDQAQYHSSRCLYISFHIVLPFTPKRDEAEPHPVALLFCIKIRRLISYRVPCRFHGTGLKIYKQIIMISLGHIKGIYTSPSVSLSITNCDPLPFQ